MAAAEASKKALETEKRFGDGPIKVSIVDASDMTFWPAENYHQDYYKRNANRYRLYRSISQRDEYIARVWGIERRE
jgi:peptide methionine sulfoxide reductase MsrA